MKKTHQNRRGLFRTVFAPVLLAGCIGLFTLTASAQQDSFNITNLIVNAVSIVSYPTNVVSTNFVATVGTITNNGVITTNGLYPGQMTGGPIETRNYTYNGFVFNGYVVNSNSAGTIVATLVRSGAANKPANYQGYETTPSLTLTIPMRIGTNVWLYWMTNLDEYYTKPAAFEGVFSLTNTSAGSYVSNAAAGLVKKIQPVSLSGGNY
jgi:hypothetical protein